jgi:hypothetical protein
MAIKVPRRGFGSRFLCRLFGLGATMFCCAFSRPSGSQFPLFLPGKHAQVDGFTHSPLFHALGSDRHLP